ncbi:flagellar basal-body rod protein FlgB [Desulfomicrobium apsheronum]|uniref:Flagellar basal body rod protein FlgB n=1 Tax=Desulfomicrobium apsheronum TaxID=52560 RepID=A0A1I3RQ14_9BACT|nr:flagellar basal body rod protein FlgB [Desulfomicrobium apsheronum]MDY0225769.1 flagellar basal body rod protein FlgB [Desulfomicrobium apsheronum]SFJ48405.1 flagellar basal-body rod protein FlgB [Desulfomicrobium apsheronum]
MKSLFPDHIDLTAKVMDFQLQRQNIVSTNLANINTPGYKARTLEFEKDLQAALGLSETGAVARTHPDHFPLAFAADTAEATVTKSLTPRVVQGVDNVDLDKEMAAMAKNNLLYNTLATVMQKSLTGLKQTIADGGK